MVTCVPKDSPLNKGVRVFCIKEYVHKFIHNNKDNTYNQIIQLIHTVRDEYNPLHYRSVDVPHFIH
jgi:hypothetical protein